MNPYEGGWLRRFMSCEDDGRSFMRLRIMRVAILRDYCEGEVEAEVSALPGRLIESVRSYEVT